MENRMKEKQDKKGTATKNSFCPKDRQDKNPHTCYRSIMGRAKETEEEKEVGEEKR